LSFGDSDWPLFGSIMFKRTDTVDWRKMQCCRDDHRNQAIPKRLASVRDSGVQPVFLNQEDALDYAAGRACFRSGEIRVLDSSSDVERVIPLDDANRKV
jgi:hypothetical protein